MLFSVAFAGMALITLQLVLALHGLMTRQTGITLLIILLSLSIVKLFMCNAVRF